MSSTEQIRNNLIDKLLEIGNKDILVAIDKLLENTIRDKDLFKTSDQQKRILQASEKDILEDRLITDEQINIEEDEWLNK